MEQKYKASQFASDLGMESKAVVELLKANVPGERKFTSSTTIDADSFDIVIDILTREHSVESFDAFEAEARPMKKAENIRIEDIKPQTQQPAAQPEAEAAPAAVKKPARKAENDEASAAKPRPKPQKTTKKEQPEAAEVKPAAENEAAADIAAKAAKVPEPAVQTEKNEVAAEPEKKIPTKPAPAAPAGAAVLGRIDLTPKKRPEQRPQQGQRGQQQGQRNQQRPQQSQQKPQQAQQPAAAAQPEKTYTPVERPAKAPRPERQPRPKKPERPKEKRPEMTTLRPQASIPVEGGVVVQQAPEASASESAVKRRVVDTRGSHIEIDRYNSRYDDMAHAKGGSAVETSTGKQKLTQKSQQYRQKGKAGKQARRETEAERMKRIANERRLKPVSITIPDSITVGELASRLKMTASEVIKKLFMLGTMATINEEIDFDTAYLVATELGAKAEREVVVTIEERIIDDSEDDDTQLVPRSPVVVVMGHVDHGKTSLLDYIRKTNVTAGEAGGITQHIGAYRVKVGDREVTFLDTPGHAAFTTMRARGAQVTDIAVLVVAADDGIMPQTVEAINHAKAAGVSIIVAINKMDKEGARTDVIMQQLTEYELVPEDWGGDVICVPVSAKTGMGVQELLENLVLVADMKELKANPNRNAKGTVIEARLDKGRGPIATVLVQNGTLHEHDIIVAGTAVGRVRAMTNDRGQIVTEAGPSFPVEIVGLDSVPTGGDIFNAVSDERLARELVEQRRAAQKEEVFQQRTKVTLDNLFSQMQEGEMKELKIIVKADVQGSVEAVRQSLEKLSNDEVRVHIIHGAVGGISESDVMLANASNAIIVGFNVRPDPVAAENAERDGVDLRLYRIIYDCIEEIDAAMKGMLAPKTRVVDLGRSEVRQTIKISSIGTIAGSYVVSGKITRNAMIRVVRDGIVIAEDQIKSLRRFKDDVKEVLQGFECGIGLEKFNDIKEGDFLEAFVIEEYRD